MVIINKREANYGSLNRKKLKYFSYEEEFYCSDASKDGSRELDKVHGIYLLIGGLILIASLCILGFDLFLQGPSDGVTPLDYEHSEASTPEPRRHNNSPASLQSTPPELAPMEYWI